MPSPFPGMDPYLEHPALWPDVHHELISAIRELLNQVIRPRYVARVEERLYLTADYEPDPDFQRVPDVTVGLARPTAAPPPTGTVAIAEPVLVRQAEPIREARVEVREVQSHEVVTVIEVLSHANKAPGSAGRRSFLEKRDEVIASPAHWVEIDLLRAGSGHRLRQRYPHHPYLVYSSPADLRPDGKVWPIRLQDPLPPVGIPLRAPDGDAALDLGKALALAYDRAGYDASVDYAADPTPPLPAELVAWADALLKEKKLR
jgi:hypothetical protein